MKNILMLYLTTLSSFDACAAEQEALPMVVIVNKHRSFSLRHRLYMLSHAIKDTCHLEISPDTGDITQPEREGHESLRITVLRQAFLEDRWATLLFINQTLIHYNQTNNLIIPTELLREITLTHTEYKDILKEEEVLENTRKTLQALTLEDR